MWSVLKFTAQMGHFGLGSLSITGRIGVSSKSSAKTAYDNLLASGHRFGVCVHYVMWFAFFHGQLWSSLLIFLVRVFLLSMLSSPVGDMFRCKVIFVDA
jgi:hypothetical protein